MKKALDQTIRDLKREVNKKVLKVPGVEQKVLDATSNEPWGPHGAHLADIAQATRNYHEYQMIMAILWKRLSDAGKNWRHVYKALTVLEYLVAHGSERVIDDIKEHAYQIMALHDFQYIDSSGRDQGNNVRRKSQSLVVLVNDKERIQEVREKANVNRDKFRNSSSTGGMHRPGSYSSPGGYGDRPDDDRYGYKDDDRNGYGRENDDRYGRGVDSYGRDGDRYGRDSDERYGRDGDRDDDHRGRSQSTDEYQYGPRSRSSDRGYDDDGRYSSRSSGARADDPSQDEGRLERKFSEPTIAPPPYEEAVSSSRSPVHDGRVTAEAPAAKASSPTGSISQGLESHISGTAASPTNPDFGVFDEFDPRGPFSAVPTTAPATANNGQVDFLGSLSNSFSSDALAIMPVTTTTSEADLPISSSSAQTFVALSSASTVLNQPAQDPFGDSPFKATQTTGNIPDNPSNFQPTSMAQSSQSFQHSAPKAETVPSFDFGDTFSGITYTPDAANSHVPDNNLQLAISDSSSNQDFDVLADILPPSGSTAPQVSQAGFSAPGGPFGQQQNNVHENFLPQGGYTAPAASQGPFYSPPVQPMQQNSNAFGNVHPQSGHTDPGAMQSVLQNSSSYGNLHPQSGHTAPVAPQPLQQNSSAYGNLQPQSGFTAPVASQEMIVTTSANTKPQKKFEPKSSVWSDTLSKGLVNFNISGPKTNPLADIGVDFDSLNRREKREKPASTNAVTSTISMGKAMGSGSGIGRAGANSIAPPSNPGMGANMGMAGRPGMGMGMPGAPGLGMGMGMGMAGNGGMGSYGGMNQPMGMNNMGMGMNNMGMGMNMAPGGQMRPPLPGQNVPGNYNTMMGPGGYPQQQYGGYR